MVKADDSGPRGPEFDFRVNLTFSVYSMDVIVNAPMTCLTLNRLQNKHSNKHSISFSELSCLECLNYAQSLARLESYLNKLDSEKKELQLKLSQSKSTLGTTIERENKLRWTLRKSCVVLLPQHYFHLLRSWNWSLKSISQWFSQFQLPHFLNKNLQLRWLYFVL